MIGLRIFSPVGKFRKGLTSNLLLAELIPLDQSFSTNEAFLQKNLFLTPSWAHSAALSYLTINAE
jgi:hypothetical protein